MTELDESVLLGEATDQHDEPLDENLLLDEKVLKEEDPDDLYEEALAPTIQLQEELLVKPDSPVTPAPVVTTTVAQTAKPAVSNEGRKYCCYVGNLLWYCTDADLLKAIASTGLARSQFADMKFFENRTNGQSKGYALLVLNSDAAVKSIMETLPTKNIHGQSPTVLAYNKTNQAKLEEVQAKNQTRPDVKKKAFEDGCLNMGTIRIGTGSQAGGRTGASSSGRSGPPPLMMQQVRPTPLMSQQSSLINNQPQNQLPTMRIQINGQPVPMVNRAPVQQQGLMGTAPMGGIQQIQAQQPMMMSQQQVRPMMGVQQMMGVQPTMGVSMAAPPPMANQFQNSSRPPQIAPMGVGVQPLMQMNTAMRPPMNGIPPVHINPQSQMFPGIQGPTLSEAEFDDVLSRNQTVSSSAITRAITDASMGDYKGAAETLLTAIALIKNSRIGHDDRCRQLVYSLEHTLKGLESKGHSSSSSRSKSYRDRSRSRERDRKRRRRSRTRSRSYSRSPSPRRRSRY